MLLFTRRDASSSSAGRAPDAIVMLILSMVLPKIQTANAIHHMKRAPIHYVARAAENEKPLVVKNLCNEVIYPGIVTQSGHAPASGGFRLDTGEQRNLTVGADWQGRVWGRTNCSFNAVGTGPKNAGGNNGGGRACGTGDCGGIVNCQATGETPVSLAEFTLATTSGQTFYDISLVDGYNIPIAIVSLYPESDNSSLEEIPPNLTNPICIGTASLLADQGSTSDAHSGTNDSFPIPLEQSRSKSDVQGWCPWDLQADRPTTPSNGIYSYPDGNLQRPVFNPCFSACAKYGRPADCCTGKYDNPNTCKPSTYSKNVKKVCPDAYSFAFDDQTSTFIIPSGGGFEVTFCPEGRSSDILAVYSKQLFQLAATGKVDANSLKRELSDSMIFAGPAGLKDSLDEATGNAGWQSSASSIEGGEAHSAPESKTRSAIAIVEALLWTFGILTVVLSLWKWSVTRQKGEMEKWDEPGLFARRGFA